jgi:uncharacterized protein (DUF488 family)
MVETRTIFTLGHSNHEVETFFELLKAHDIQVVVDVRSKPYSRYAKHFNKAELESALAEQGLEYVFLGRELGGMPEENSFYNASGQVMYGPLSRSSEFKKGLAELLAIIDSGKRAALTCGEENPMACHRRLLIGRVLEGMGIEVLHIRKDGASIGEAALAAEAPEQGCLFPDDETFWCSPLPVRKESKPAS